jgi:hypothetical protein
MGATSEWHFLLRLLSGSVKIWILVILKLWMLIASSNQTFLKHEKALSYSLQKDLSKGVLHAPIGDHLIFALKGFLVRSQIPNLIFGLSFDHNSYI